jgi:hypothetical protein
MTSLARSAQIAVLLALGAGFSHATHGTEGAQIPQPSLDGTVRMSGRMVAAGIGYTWGRGTLTYHGEDYVFCIRGLSVGDVGVAELKAQGLVFNLHDLHDFTGKYFAASMGVAVVAGESAAMLKNQHAVNIQLETQIKGLRFNIAASGLRIWLAGQNKCGN